MTPNENVQMIHAMEGIAAPAALRQNRPVLIGTCLLIGLVLVGSVLVPGFLSMQNARSILLLAAFLAIASLGQTLVALLGGLDLSIPYVIGGANILVPSLINSGVPPLLAIATILAAGLIVGALNGMLSFRLQGQALIMSLGLGFAVVGGAQIYTTMGSTMGGNVFAPIPAWLTNISAFNGRFFGLPLPPLIVIWVAIAAVMLFVVRQTWFGRSLYAVGGNRVAASRLLISEFRAWVAVHAISGLTAAMTGVLLLGFSGGGYVAVGDPYLFTTVAAVVIGGTSLLGGSGGYGATVVGALVLTVLTSLLVGLGLSFAAQQAIVGLLIIPMVALYARTPHIRSQI
jgi:ribose transport system permease protein